MRKYDEEKLMSICEFVKEYQKEEGRSPSYREIGRHIGQSNPGMAARYIKELERRGLLNKENDGTIAIDTRLFSGHTRNASLVGAVACGMPIFAEENIEGTYQLPTEIFGSSEHFLLMAKGYSMIDKGIEDGDIIVVEKANTAYPGQVVIALIGDEATAKIFLPQKNKVILRAANESVDANGNRNYPDIVVKECQILGIVDKVIHSVN